MSGRRMHQRVTAAIVAAAAAIAVAPVAASTAGPAGGATTLLSVTGSTSLAQAAASVESAGGAVVARYDVAGALLATLPDGVGVPVGLRAVPDSPMSFTGSPTADLPVSTVRATIGQGSAQAGAGTTVAVVDTGVADVGDLAGRLVHVNVSGDPIGGDGYGHGTFLAGLVAGDGSASNGAYAGVAPAATVLDVKVADAAGATSLSRVLAGLQAVADRGDVDVVTLALSTGSPLPPVVDPLSRALDTLWGLGVTVVVAAGNDGPQQGTVSSPGSDPMLLTVGAVDEARTAARADDVVADFSARSRRFGVTKPELVAPGVSLVSLRAPGSIADVDNPGSVVGTDYFRGTGTSMSAAVVAGAAANLLSARPDLLPDAVKALLTGTGYAVPGASALDLSAALAAPVPALPGVTPAGDPFGPGDEDRAAWEAFAAAWQSGSLEAVRAAWLNLRPQARRWAATAWATSLVTDSAAATDEEFAALVLAARRWAAEDWAARRWANDEWVARRWSGADWFARRWADEEWLARRWSGDDWLAFAWTARRWSAAGWASTAWEARRWSARRWSAQDWTSTAWEARRWSQETWTARRWSVTSWPQG